MTLWFHLIKCTDTLLLIIDFNIVALETFFEKRSLLINMKIKLVTNKIIFFAIFRFISLIIFNQNFL